MGWGSVLSKIVNKWNCAVDGRSLDDKRRECEIELYKVKMELETQISQDKYVFHESEGKDKRAEKRMLDAALGLMLVEQLSQDMKDTVKDAKLDTILNQLNGALKKGNAMAGFHPVFRSGGFQKGVEKLTNRINSGNSNESDGYLKPYQEAAKCAVQRILDPCNEFNSSSVGESVKKALCDMESEPDDVQNTNTAENRKIPLKEATDEDFDRGPRLRQDNNVKENNPKKPDFENSIMSEAERKQILDGMQKKFR